jgi:hypothetical protein
MPRATQRRTVRKRGGTDAVRTENARHAEHQHQHRRAMNDVATDDKTCAMMMMTMIPTPIGCDPDIRAILTTFSGQPASDRRGGFLST